MLYKKDYTHTVELSGSEAQIIAAALDRIGPTLYPVLASALKDAATTPNNSYVLLVIGGIK